MQIVQQSTHQRRSWLPIFWRGLVRLDFLSNFFTWLMELLARVAEPLASLGSEAFVQCLREAVRARQVA